jgi:hypothetical protein
MVALSVFSVLSAGLGVNPFNGELGRFCLKPMPPLRQTVQRAISTAILERYEFIIRAPRSSSISSPSRSITPMSKAFSEQPLAVLVQRRTGQKTCNCPSHHRRALTCARARTKTTASWRPSRRPKPTGMPRIFIEPLP